ncbi:MAG: chorismate synthase [Bacteroidales bacterium]|nr:chorismate synthase [Bacteroidales bacterium]
MNRFGNQFNISLFGESHGPAVGIVIDGVKPGLLLSETDFEADIARRRSGAAGTTPRKEPDLPEILSGVFEGHTTGAPLALVFRNTNTHSEDYELFKKIPRPGHVDYVASVKFGGFEDPRGGGHFSGRMTLPLVAAGVVAKKMLPCTFSTSVIEMGGSADPSVWPSLLEAASQEGDSLGGIVECRISGVPAGLGEPFFDTVESLVSHLVFAIPGVRGVEFGDGFAAARMKGSEHNDPLAPASSQGSPLVPITSHAGGVNGGLTNGGEIVFRVAFKPASSIRKPQQTWNIEAGREDTLVCPGRHDACIALRGAVVVEAAAAIVLADLL